MRIRERSGMYIVVRALLSMSGMQVAAEPGESKVDLLAEILQQLESSSILHGPVNCKLRVTWYRPALDALGELTTVEMTVEEAMATAQRISPDLLRVDGKSWDAGESQPMEGVYIRKGKEAWRAQPDRKTRKFFLTEHGENMVVGQEIEYLRWICAPYMIGALPLADYLREGTIQTVSEILSIDELVDESGDRLLRCVLRIRNRSKPNGPSSELTAVLYRDQQCAIKTATYESISSTGDNTLLLQTCEYAPFTAGEPPVLLVVTETRQSRPANEPDTAYATYLRKVAEYSDYNFKMPDLSKFNITQVVDMPARTGTIRTDSLKWFFGANGLFLLAVWYLLSRRQRRRVHSNSGSAA